MTQTEPIKGGAAHVPFLRSMTFCSMTVTLNTGMQLLYFPLTSTVHLSRKHCYCLFFQLLLWLDPIVYVPTIAVLPDRNECDAG